MNDFERLEFIKHRTKYLFFKITRGSGKNYQIIDDIIWLISKAEKQIEKEKKWNKK